MADATSELDSNSGDIPGETLPSESSGGEMLDVAEFEETSKTGEGLTTKDLAALGQNFFKKLTGSNSRADLFMALGVVGILVILIIPMPTWMLDLSLAFSITFSVMILMTVIFINKPLSMDDLMWLNNFS